MVALRDPFPPEQVGKLPGRSGGPELDYVGHGNVTDRLLDVDPEWNWEPVAYAPDGLPLFDRDGQGNPIGLWIRLTVDGVSRLGYGDCPSTQFHAEKVLIGDALRNAAMRFGVALALWMKGHSEDAESFNADGPRNRKPPEDLTVSGQYAADYTRKAGEAGLMPFDVEEIVLAVTGGRTADVQMVLESERPALVERTRVVVAQKAVEGPQTPSGSPDSGETPSVAPEATGRATGGVWDKVTPEHPPVS